MNLYDYGLFNPCIYVHNTQSPVITILSSSSLPYREQKQQSDKEGPGKKEKKKMRGYNIRKSCINERFSIVDLAAIRRNLWILCAEDGISPYCTLRNVAFLMFSFQSSRVRSVFLILIAVIFFFHRAELGFVSLFIAASFLIRNRSFATIIKYALQRGSNR